MVLSIVHNNAVHLIKITLSRRGKHILQVQIQNSKAAVRKVLVFCAMNVRHLFIALICTWSAHSVCSRVDTISIGSCP